MTRRMEFIFGGVAMTLSEKDIEEVLNEWENKNPGKKLSDMKSTDFADACIERIKSSARPTRTVLHN